ncbi:MAG TPA: hypothetical protein VFQ61_39615 [Polyangiaceae bacterium]|nr:hypothetical protein [Polyangiaceae bacterium]
MMLVGRRWFVAALAFGAFAAAAFSSRAALLSQGIAGSAFGQPTHSEPHASAVDTKAFSGSLVERAWSMLNGQRPTPRAQADTVDTERESDAPASMRVKEIVEPWAARAATPAPPAPTDFSRAEALDPWKDGSTLHAPLPVPAKVRVSVGADPWASSCPGRAACAAASAGSIVDPWATH